MGSQGGQSGAGGEAQSLARGATVVPPQKAEAQHSWGDGAQIRGK